MFPSGNTRRVGGNPVAVRHDVQLKRAQRCGDDILILEFSRPGSYAFKAGQWFRLTLQTTEGEVTKTFSHCSAPSDPDLEMTTRLSGSAFKQALAAVKPGDHVQIAGPGGRLAIPEGADRIAFLVGGVGITPVHSLLRDAKARGRAFADALLLYGNRDESCMPFSEELLGMEDAGVRTVLCLERPSADWEGERGFITAEMVRRHVDPDDGQPFMVAGPPPMVSAMERVLDELGIEPERRILERFSEARA
jgi:glycine betaine catabolism B